MLALSPVASRRLPISVRSLLAALVWLAAYGLTLALQPWIERTAFVFFWIAVIYAAWAAGLVPALLASVASVLAVHYHLIESRRAFWAWDVSELLTFTIFVVASLRPR
jgi:K+-sensing histidine kinase KdpD